MIIFDLDQTLVDTSSVEALRTARKWGAVMGKLSALEVYPGITELLLEAHDAGEPLAIVTKSPDMIPKGLIKLHRWPIQIVVGYHDVVHRKPDPEGLIKAMGAAGVSANDTLHIGDQPEDTAASRAAGVTAVGAVWGATDPKALTDSAPDHLFASVDELATFLRTRW